MIVVTGSLAFDTILNFPGKFAEQIIPEKIHVLSVSFLVNKLSKTYGGTAGNIAYNLGLLNHRAVLLGSVGKDFSDYRKHLDKVKVNTKVKVYKNEYTAQSIVFSDLDDNQISGLYPGAMVNDKKIKLKDYLKDITPQDRCIRHAEEHSDEGSPSIQGDSSAMPQNDGHASRSGSHLYLIISPNTIEAINSFVDQSIELKIPYLYAPGQQIVSLDKKSLIKGTLNAEILIGNDYEISLLLKKTGLTKPKILTKDRILIVTLGEKGSNIYTSKGKISIRACRVEKICDPTGAGDAYIAGFACGFVNGFNLETCGRIGSCAASYTIEKFGTQEHKYVMEEFRRRFEKNYRKKFINLEI